MADTVRSLTALQTLLATNANNEVNAQDLRDFLVTALMPTASTTVVTTSDVTADVGKFHRLDISGLTATRNFILPVGAEGDVIKLIITDGDPDYELIIKGAAGVSINGGTVATEWSRLFIDNESVEFRASSATNWDIINDGRIPVYGRLGSVGGTNQTYTSGTWAIAGAALMSQNVSDNASVVDTTNGRIKVRRSGTYTATAGTFFSPIDGDTRIAVRDNADANYLSLSSKAEFSSGLINGGNQMASVVELTTTMVAIKLKVLQISTGSNSLLGNTGTYIELLESL